MSRKRGHHLPENFPTAGELKRFDGVHENCIKALGYPEKVADVVAGIMVFWPMKARTDREKLIVQGYLDDMDIWRENEAK